MRLAILINEPSNLHCDVELGLLDETIVFSVMLRFARLTDKGTKFIFKDLFVRSGDNSASAKMFLNDASSVLAELAKYPLIDLTIRDLLYEAGRNGGRQVAFDPEARKYVMVKTLRSKDTSWLAIDSEGKTIVSVPKAKDEADAKTKLGWGITDLMAKNPQNAVKLAKWFQDGQQVKKAVGTAVKFVDIDVLEPIPPKVEDTAQAKTKKDKK